MPSVSDLTPGGVALVDKQFHEQYYMNMRSYSCCTTTTESTDVASLASLLRIIGEPNRLRILCIMQNGEEHCVCEFGDHMKDVSQSLLSHHLADLREAGLVESEKRGLRAYYRLTKLGAETTATILSLTTKGE